MIFRLKFGACADIFRKLGRKYEKCPEIIIDSNETETESVWIVFRRSKRNSDINTLLSGFPILMILNPISVISEPGIHCEGFHGQFEV